MAQLIRLLVVLLVAVPWSASAQTTSAPPPALTAPVNDVAKAVSYTHLTLPTNREV